MPLKKTRGKQYKKKSKSKSKSSSKPKPKTKSHKKQKHKQKKVSTKKKNKKTNTKPKRLRGGSKYFTLTPSEYYSVKHNAPYTLQSSYNKFEGKPLPNDPNPIVQNLQQDQYDISPSDDLIV